MEGTSMLPKELEIEILLRLSVKSLFRFKTVCRNWQSVIGSSLFKTRYCQKSNAKDYNSKLLCTREDPSTQTHVVSIIDGQTTTQTANLEWPPFLDEGVQNKEMFKRRINILGPVNGMYCIFSKLIEVWVGTVVLWNPATKEYKQLYPFAVFPFSSNLLSHKWNEKWSYEMRHPYNLNIGFGFDYNANDFKVIIICQWGRVYGGDDDRWHARVYSLYADSWRTLCNHRSSMNVMMPLKDIFPPFPNIDSEPEFAHCHLNGVYHWSCEWAGDDDQSCHGILAFNMSDDSFQLISGPPLGAIDEYEYFWCRSVWVLKNTLAMVATTVQHNSGSPTGNIQLWIMWDYGVKDSWTLLHSFGPTPGLSPIAIPNDDQIFCRDENEQLVSFDFDDRTYKQYGIHGAREILFHPIDESLGVLRYVETLVPLNLKHQQHQN